MWVENVENPEATIGLVTNAEDIKMPEADHPEDKGREVVAYYGFKIETVKGTCTIDYRNESNGYYGGSLEWPGEHHYGGVYGQNVSKEVWVKLA